MKININNKRYEVKTEWHDITLKLAKKLTEIEIPDELKLLYGSKTEKEYKANLQPAMEADNIEFCRKVINTVSDIPMGILANTNEGVYYFYYRYLEKFIVDLYRMFPSSYEPKGGEGFIFNGKVYKYPTEEVMLNDTKPFAYETAETFIESMDLRMAMQDKVIRTEGLSGLVAIYAREEGETYSEQRVIQKVKEFENLTMDIAWEVFFCLRTLSIGLEQRIPKYFQRVEKGERKLDFSLS